MQLNRLDYNVECECNKYSKMDMICRVAMFEGIVNSKWRKYTSNKSYLVLSPMNCEAENKPLFYNHIEVEKGKCSLSLWKQLLVISA